MKKLRGAAALVGIVLMLGFLLRAQTQSDSVSFTYSENLQLVAPEKVPPTGTFHLLSGELDDSGEMSRRPLPPFPFDPYDGTLPIYTFDLLSGEFLVGDTPEDYESLQQSNTMMMSVPPAPGEGSEEDPQSFSPAYDYSTNNLWLEIASVTNGAATFVIHTPTTNAVYDLFGTTNLNPAPNLNVANWTCLLRTSAGQTNVVLTNLWPNAGFFILGKTNDADGGGLTDAFEILVTRSDTNSPADDLLIPLVGMVAGDSLAHESGDTAQFVVSRLGGYLGFPLTVQCRISGTATNGTDYTLSPAASSATNIAVTIPAGLSSAQIILSGISDSNIEGTETATLTLATNANWTVNSAASNATVWILEEYTKVYTTVTDFNLGVMAGLDSVLGSGNGQLQFKTNLPPQFPFINVACSARGTVARINTTNGVVIGEYSTTPDTIPGPSPSRTTVDQYGNVWVANRSDDLFFDGASHGSITRIGLIVGGTRHIKTNGIYVPDANGQYISISNAAYNTCIDRDGDEFIRTSSGLADILPWTNERNAVENIDSFGGVSTAEDEAILHYIRLPCRGTRTIAVDKFNDIWVGGHLGNRTHLKINALPCSIVPNSAFDSFDGGYGGVIDSLGNLWSSPDGQADINNGNSFGVIRLVPPAAMPPTTNDWQDLFNQGPGPYGIAVDPLHPYIWQTCRNGEVFRWSTNGAAVTNLDGSLQLFESGNSFAQGLTVDNNGHVWVAHGIGSNTVGHLDTNGFLLGSVLLRLSGLRAEYYDNTDLSGDPVFVRADGQIDLNWGSGSPDPIVPTNNFSAKWSGVLLTREEGDHVFYVSADAGAGFRLTVDQTTIIDNWDNPDPSAVELSGTNWLWASNSYDIVLEYKEFTGDARVKLSWKEAGTTNKVVIPSSQLKGPDVGSGPTGVSVDSFGKIWAANQDSNNAMRIDPNAGDIVVTNGVTNHVGEVDMVVNLGSGARPYNYSDMTGFNNRVVNPAFAPLKGYWTVIHDSGLAEEVWKKVSWNATNGSAVEVFARASDDRQALANQTFLSVTNDVAISSVQGRYIEVRAALIRPTASQQPLLYDLTLQGDSSYP